MPRCDIPSSMKEKPWRWPWIVMIVALYVFGLPWIYGAIVQRYWVEKEYDAVLVGLDDTPARQFFMVTHMSLGAVCLLCGPTQFLPVIRRKWPTFHRWCGRIYVLPAVFCSIFGQVFICLKGFVLVGGLNMGFAFCVAGILFGVFAVLSAFYARHRQFTQHRNWAIRSYGQILAPMLYRYFYLILGGLRLYPSGTELDCDDNDVCHPFTRTLDAIHAWTYFLFPLLCTEFIIRFLPKYHSVESTSEEEPTEKQGNVGVTAEGENMDGNNAPAADTGEDLELQKNSTIPFNFIGLNLLGVLGATCCVGSTVLIYVTGFLGTNTVST